MSARKPLSMTQLLILSTAAQRPDRMVLPLPAALRARGASQTRLLVSLLKVGMVEEVVPADEALIWRQDESGGRFALRITVAGLEAVGSSDPEPMAEACGDTMVAPALSLQGSEPEISAMGPQPSASEPLPLKLAEPLGVPAQPGGKLGLVLTAITTDSGATANELVALTGWLPHTTRAAITGLRRRGFAVRLTEHEGRRAYRLATEH